MKKLITPFFIVAALSAFSQEKNPNNGAVQQNNPRTAATSARVDVSPAPESFYDVNDKYMGRRDEFLNLMTVPELPADFPIYDKQWGLKEYNAVVDAYCMKHMDILKERVKQKVQLQIDKQQAK